MNLPAWRYYMRFYRGSYPSILLSILLSVGQALVVLPIPFLIYYVFDEILGTTGDNLYSLISIGGSLLLLYLLNVGLILWLHVLGVKVTKLATQRVRYALLEKLYSFSRCYYMNTRYQNQLHACMVQDTENLDTMSHTLIARLLPALITSVLLSSVLIYLHWFLFVVLVGVTPFMLFIVYTLGETAKKQVKVFHHVFKIFSQGVASVLQMMDLIKIQAVEAIEIEKQKKQFDNLRVVSSTLLWSFTTFSLIQSAMIAVVGVIILVVGGHAVLIGTLSIGKLLMFFVILILLRHPLQNLSAAMPHIVEGSRSLEVLFHWLNSSDQGAYEGQKHINFSGEITMEGVAFRCETQPVLLDVSLTLKPHTTIAVIGPASAGKSVLGYLIAGLYRPQQGRIYADGYLFDELDMADLRQHIGFVTQEPLLFNGTITENITYGCPDLTVQQVIQVAKLATAHTFIQHLPQGYDTLLGEGGVNLSSEQRQRIAIARALARRPVLLILDEPTDYLDKTVVAQLIYNLRNMTPALTLLIMSCDMEIVQWVHDVYVLQEGRIITYHEHKIPYFHVTSVH